MKKTATYIFLALAMIFIIFILLYTTKQEPTDQTAKLKIGTTVFPLYDITNNIVGDKADVVQILTSGASPHTFELTPQKVKQLVNTKIIFKIGVVDDWVDPVSDSINEAKILTVNKNINLIKNIDLDHTNSDEYIDENNTEHDSDNEDHEHDTVFDPHYWLSISNAKTIAQNIYNQVSAADPENKAFYKLNLENYLVQLDQLSIESKSKLSKLENKKIIIFHDAWQYFTKEYDLEILATFQPSPGKQPTPQDLKLLANLIQENNIKVIFTEPQLSSDTIEPFVKDFDLQIFVLDPLGGVEDRNSYIDLMKYNVDTVHEALIKTEQENK